ncbi:hypothetical protein SRAA_0816 [Serpentinimonas raichei]|uniref:Uncharacterized protein n=1 Tax=Serpentinimonas raichei TaxID=1458425 RepID=A0A060NID5_9BURK|nr:hypothetical protein [Serpentinimonas raichei]BAO80670.1 hypothetical protein SRAA_0816 [Serpentinimonas raichei]
MYHGKLYYEEGNDVFTIEEFIDRCHDVAFKGSTTWDAQDEWTIEATAQKVGDSYVTPPTFSKHKISKQDCSDAAVITIKIINRAASSLEVEGSWAEAGETYKFKGTLV